MATLMPRKNSLLKVGVLQPLLCFFIVDLLILSLSRLLLSIWQSERAFAESRHYAQIFIGGLRIDLSSLGYLFAPALLLIIIATLIRIVNKEY